jgi:hypothetical protein
MSLHSDEASWPRRAPLRATLTCSVDLCPRRDGHRRTMPAAELLEVMDKRWKIETVGPSIN